jgi:hypothetical protein
LIVSVGKFTVAVYSKRQWQSELSIRQGQGMNRENYFAPFFFGTNDAMLGSKIAAAVFRFESRCALN